MKLGTVMHIAAVNFVMPAHVLHLNICLVTTRNLKNKQTWLQLFFDVKATALKLQTSKFYLQILSTEARFYVYGGPLI